MTISVRIKIATAAPTGPAVAMLIGPFHRATVRGPHPWRRFRPRPWPSHGLMWRVQSQFGSETHDGLHRRNPKHLHGRNHLMTQRRLANNLISLSQVLILPAAVARSGSSALVSASSMDLAGTSDATLTHRTALAVNAPESTVQIASREQDGSWIYYNAHAGRRAYRCKIYKLSTLLSVTQGPPNCSPSSR